MGNIPFPFLMLLGCVTLVWAVQSPRRTPEDQQLRPGQEGEQNGARTPLAGHSWTGIVSDSNCGARHSTASQEAAQCVSKCVASGAKYVLVSGGSVFQADPQDELASYAGKTVTVKGSLQGDTITIAIVSPVRPSQ